jgi:hypothetical protein
MYGETYYGPSAGWATPVWELVDLAESIAVSRI